MEAPRRAFLNAAQCLHRQFRKTGLPFHAGGSLQLVLGYETNAPQGHCKPNDDWLPKEQSVPPCTRLTVVASPPLSDCGRPVGGTPPAHDLGLGSAISSPLNNGSLEGDWRVRHLAEYKQSLPCPKNFRGELQVLGA